MSTIPARSRPVGEMVTAAPITSPSLVTGLATTIGARRQGQIVRFTDALAGQRLLDPVPYGPGAQVEAGLGADGEHAVPVHDGHPDAEQRVVLSQLSAQSGGPAGAQRRLGDRGEAGGVVRPVDVHRLGVAGGHVGRQRIRHRQHGGGQQRQVGEVQAPPHPHSPQGTMR
ncbi:hypothetical protein [Actinoallomurus acanthiterrae]